MKLRIISGGQTGADRAALDLALRHGIPHGGWCPKGRKAEDGVIPARYQLKEHQSDEYIGRTEQNVIDSDGTVIFSVESEVSGGTLKAAEFAKKHNKPVLQIQAGNAGAGALLGRFIEQHRIQVLNVAGPRASEEPRIGAFVTRVLEEAIQTPVD